MNELWTYTKSAEYCGLPETYFRNQVKHGSGPTYLQPSPKRVFFRKEDLDEWVATWKQLTRKER
jgi:hypothetical protein